MNNLIKKATYISVLVVCAYFMKPEKVDAGVAGWTLTEEQVNG